MPHHRPTLIHRSALPLLALALLGGCDKPYGDLGQFGDSDSTGGSDRPGGFTGSTAGPESTSGATDPTGGPESTSGADSIEPGGDTTGACAAPDPDVELYWELRRPGETHPAPAGLAGACTVTAAAPSGDLRQVDLDCLVAGASTPLEFVYRRAPGPDIAALTPGASLLLDYRTVGDEVIDDPNGLAWIALRDVEGAPPVVSAIRSYKLAPAQLPAEDFHGLALELVDGVCPIEAAAPCDPERLAVAVGGAATPVLDGRFAALPGVRAWIGSARVEHDTTDCFDLVTPWIVALFERSPD